MKHDTETGDVSARIVGRTEAERFRNGERATFSTDWPTFSQDRNSKIVEYLSDRNGRGVVFDALVEIPGAFRDVPSDEGIIGAPESGKTHRLPSQSQSNSPRRNGGSKLTKSWAKNSDSLVTNFVGTLCENIPRKWDFLQGVSLWHKRNSAGFSDQVNIPRAGRSQAADCREHPDSEVSFGVL